jgi:hypothetical protein
MEFDTGPDVQPGHDITVGSGSSAQDLGQATYDSDHDGVADSVIVFEGDHEYIITDADHDGHADAMHVYDADGREVDPSTGAPVAGSSGAGTTPNTGTTANTGTTTNTGTTSDTGTTSHTGTSTGGAATGHDLTVTGDDGSAHSLGAPTVDINQDGSPDTAVVHNTDGSVTAYTDRDGDGRADQITQIGADGKVVIAVHGAGGEWEVSTTGHLDASGHLVPDSTPNTAAGLNPSDSDGVTTGHPSTGTASHPGTTGAAGTGTEPVPAGAPISGNAPAGDITFTDGGKNYDLGHPTTDINGDGTPDTVVTHLPDGTVVGYSDTDGDGAADQVTRISPDGHVVIGVSDGHGGWHQAATGRLDHDGKFVPDGSTSGVPAGSPATG